MIQITPSLTGFAISFDYALKDNFKAAFPSAKWDAASRRWIVGPRSEKRLRAWAEAAKGAQEAAQEAAAVEEASTELHDAERKLVLIEEERRKWISKHASLVSIKSLLSEKREEIASAAQACSKAKAAADAERAEVIRILSDLVDMAEINDALKQMGRWQKAAGSTAKTQYNQAQRVIIKARDTLADAGLASRGLNWLAEANFNRPHRDGGAVRPRHSGHSAPGRHGITDTGQQLPNDKARL